MPKTLLTTLLGLILFASACTFVEKIRDGDTAFDRKQYAVAITMLKKEHDKAKSRVEKGKKAFLLGEAYRLTDQAAQSISWYQRAYDNSYGVDALKQYAYALKQTEQYAEAKQAFKNLGIEIGSPYEYRREIQACEKAIAWKEEEKNTAYRIKSLPINSSSADYSPTFYADQQLVFTSDRSNSVGEEAYNWTGNKFSDLFVADLQSNTVESFSPVINSEQNEGSVAFNASHTMMIFTRCFSLEKYGEQYCKLMLSEKEGESWTSPITLNFIEDKVNYMHPCLSEDGSLLYFSAEHPDGWGGYDIFVAERNPDGWDQPRLLSRSVNTIGNELFPTLDRDTLYFASDHHPGMGGLDIFRVHQLGSQRWSLAQNLKGPINSGGDDFGLIIDRSFEPTEDVRQKGYFSSSRMTGSGSDDIFAFEKGVPPPVADTVTAPVEEIVYEMILEGYVLEKIYQTANDPNSTVLGRKPLPGAVVEVGFNEGTERIEVDENGYFRLVLAEEMDYDFLAKREGYLNNTDRFSTRGIGQDPAEPIRRFEIEIVLDKLFKNQEIVLENIYYDFNESFIRKDAQPTLNELAALLAKNPDISIQLSSHTDCRGQDRYNERLSQDRAQAAVDYLITKGIPAERLTAKGYGENVPSVDCLCSRCSEEEHQANRRTTFKVLE